MNKRSIFGSLVLVAAITGLIYYGDSASAQSAASDDETVKAGRPESNTPQTLPFSQDWTADLITTNDDWSTVPGIVGFRGDDMTPGTGTDPRTLLAEFGLPAGAVIDVNINQTLPDTFATGGVAEFEIANRVVALNGSGTGDAPYIVLYLNTTAQNNIRVSYNARDLDASADNAIQQIATQYRVGNTGNFINVPGGYIADATTGGTATQVTAVAVTLPAAANNQPEVQVRIMTTNAAGNDEWVGIDDISVTAVASPATANAAVDFNGDLKTDFSVVRGSGVNRAEDELDGVSGPFTWYTLLNGPGTVTGTTWGFTGDVVVTEDFDGDNKSDIAVWRSGAQGRFYIIRSSNGVVDVIDHGQTGDNPRVVGDYDGDGKADLAVYRPGVVVMGQPTPSHWWYRRSTVGGAGCSAPGACNDVTFGQAGDVPAPGDYDGDGKNDFVVRRSDGGGNARFWLLTAAGVASNVPFGGVDDLIVPGDYDGDGKTDIAIARNDSGQGSWWWRPSGGGADVNVLWGDANQDEVAHGDYDGDGKTDPAVWRNGNFLVRGSASGPIGVPWGAAGDFPVASFNGHGNN